MFFKGKFNLQLIFKGGSDFVFAKSINLTTMHFFGSFGYLQKKCGI